MSDWLNRYQARKQGAPRPAPVQQPYAPPPAPVPPQGYGPPPPAYPPGYPQPVPGAPPHAPFGYDPMSGHPVAPYGYDVQGHVIVQPPYQQPQQYAQPPQQPGYQPNGLPAPQGYGQPPYGQVQPGVPGPPMPPPAPDGTPQGFHDRVRYAISHVEGNTPGNREIGVCQQCGGAMVPTDARGFNVPDGMPQSAGVFNSTTGQTVFPAAHCAACGAINRADGSGYSPGAGTAAMGVGVKVVGTPRLAPGAGSAQQVAHQHGLPNLFAQS